MWYKYYIILTYFGLWILSLEMLKHSQDICIQTHEIHQYKSTCHKLFRIQLKLQVFVYT